MEQTRELTAQTPSRAETLLEDGISEVMGEVANLMVLARAVDPAAYEFGHRRSGVYSDAVNLLKTSAKLGHTIAELRGSKFEHNINVRRQEIGTKSASDEEEEEEEEEEDNGWMWIGDETLFNWKTKRTFKLQKPVEAKSGSAAENLVEGTSLAISEGSNGNPQQGDPASVLEGSSGNPKQGDPPPILQGSNGNFGDTGAGEPRIRSL